MADDEAGRRSTGDPAEAFRRLDAQDDGEPSGEVEEREPVWPRLKRQLAWLTAAMVALGAVGFGAGWIFAQTSGSTASRLLLTDRVVTEPDATEVGGADVPGAGVAPSSGESDTPPRCGVHVEPVAPDAQIAALGVGAVVIQYRTDDLDPDDVATLEGLVGEVESHLLIAPNPAIRNAVVATAWRHRLEMDEVERAALEAFIDGYRDPQEDCPG